jgi:signal transduction histidine kinase
MNRLLLSPVAMGFLPVVVLHVVVLAYFLGQKHKSGQTKLLVGWFFSMGLMSVAQFAMRVIGGPLEIYLGWLGSMCSALAAQLLWLQFAYHFPRLVYAREARVALGISIAIIVVTLGLIVSEVLVCPKELSYSFEKFIVIISGPCDDQVLRFGQFNTVIQPLVYLWSLIVWLREVYTFSSTVRPGGLGPRSWRGLRALWQPLGKEAKAARAFCLVMLTAVAPLVAVTLEPRGILPVGTFSATWLLSLFAIILVYVNNSPESSTFLVKLVGVSLVTLLVVLGVVNLMILDAHQETYEQARLIELDSVKSLIEVGHIDLAPAQVQYVVARPASGGLFSTSYQLIFSRVQGLSAQFFVEQDARLLSGLAQGTLTGQWAVAFEHTWIGPEAATWSLGEGLERLAIPEGVRTYRGTFSPPQERYIRYAFVLGDVLYEVGYSHASYLQDIHRTAMPLVGLTIGATVLVVLGFPLFFRVSLIRPLQNLLRGVARVDDGDLDVTVPIEAEDEIGFLTTAFNRMVRSLSASEADLRSEIAERQRAEDEARALSVMLEQRVADRTRDLTALYEVSATASHALDLETLLSESLARTMAAMQVGMGLVCLLEEERSLHTIAQRGVPVELMAQIEDVMGDRDVVDWLVEHREPMLLRDIFYSGTGSAAPPSALVAPMCAGGQVQGILCLIQGSPQGFSMEEVTLLASVADQVGVAVQSDRLRAQAQEASVLQERQRLARDLHDSVTQSLYSLTLLAEGGRRLVKAGTLESAEDYFADLRQIALQSLKEMRLLIYELRSPVLEQEGLVGALQQRLDAVEGRTGVETRLLVEEEGQLAAPVEEALYRIAVEALNNILKHAAATSVMVQVRINDERAELEIVDDGRGFDPEAITDQGGMGLVTMRERTERLGGTLTILSAPGEGTKVEVTL